MNNRKKLNRLFAKTQTCHWCGILTRRLVPANGETSLDDMATFDHLVEGSNVMRPVPIPRPGVLACYRCNQTRAEVYHKARSAFLRAARVRSGDENGESQNGACSPSDQDQRPLAAKGDA